MWRYILLFGIVIALPAVGWCDTVQFAVPPANIGTVYAGGSVDLYSSGLNGTVLAGQSLTLDLVLSDHVLARLYANDPGALGIELELYTTADTYPGFLGATTGFLLDPIGSQFGDTLVAGRADGSNGTTGAGLVEFTSEDLEDENVFDISGAEFETSLPSSGYVITDAELIFTLNDVYNGVQFGTEQQLPEPSTLAMTLMGLLALTLAAGRRSLKRRSVSCS